LKPQQATLSAASQQMTLQFIRFVTELFKLELLGIRFLLHPLLQSLTELSILSCEVIPQTG